MNNLLSPVGFLGKLTLRWGLVVTLLIKECFLVSAHKKRKGGRNVVDAGVELGCRRNSSLCPGNSGTRMALQHCPELCQSGRAIQPQH